MKKMKKPISLVLALIVCLCLAGCGNKENSTPSNNSSSTNNSVSAPNDSSSNDSGNSAANVIFEPVEETVTDITVDAQSGYGFHHRFVYGNAFSLIYSYGSNDGNIISNAPISIIPIEMKNLDDILATEWCASIKKEDLVEADFGDGTTGWMSTEDAAEKLAKQCGDYSFDELYEEMKIIELCTSGVSQQDAIAQAKAKLFEAGLAGLFDEK